MTDEEEFAEFWRHYPRKVAKGDARKAWHQVRSIRPPLETMLEAIKKACRCEQWMRDGGMYVPYPATWLRAERWEDDYTVTLVPRLPDVTGVGEDKPKVRSAEEIEQARKVFALIKQRAA